MATKNQIGRMDKRIRILIPNDTQLPGGGGETTYTELLSTWAEVLPVKSQVMLTDSQMELQDSMQFNIRYSTDGRSPKKRMQIVYAGQQYTISGIKEIREDKRFWQIIATVNIEYTT